MHLGDKKLSVFEAPVFFLLLQRFLDHRQKFLNRSIQLSAKMRIRMIGLIGFDVLWTRIFEHTFGFIVLDWLNCFHNESL